MPFWRRTRVRLDGGGVYDGPGDFVPQLPSKHEQLLADVDTLPHASWSAKALCALLEGVRDHRGIEDIAIADAWVEDDDTFCVVYTPPWGSVALAGTRRRRGDHDPVEQVVASLPSGDALFETSDDPERDGSMVLDDISQPLGHAAELLRYDADGIGWWGTLTDTLPGRH